MLCTSILVFEQPVNSYTATIQKGIYLLIQNYHQKIPRFSEPILAVR